MPWALGTKELQGAVHPCRDKEGSVLPKTDSIHNTRVVCRRGREGRRSGQGRWWYIIILMSLQWTQPATLTSEGLEEVPLLRLVHPDGWEGDGV